MKKGWPGQCTMILHALALLIAGTQASHVSTVLGGMNRMRSDAHLPPLCLSSQLSESAETQAKYQCEMGQMTHDNPLSIGARILSSGFPLSEGVAGENVGEQQELDGTKIMEAWSLSPGHRENILRPEHQFVGIAMRQSPVNRTWYWAVHFAKGTGMVCQESAPTSAQPSTSTQIVEDLVSALDDQMHTGKVSTVIINAVTTLAEQAREYFPEKITITETRSSPTTVYNVITVTVTEDRQCPPCPLVTCKKQHIQASAASSTPLETSTPTRTVIVYSTGQFIITTTIGDLQSSQAAASHQPSGQANQTAAASSHSVSVTTIYKCPFQ